MEGDKVVVCEENKSCDSPPSLRLIDEGNASVVNERVREVVPDLISNNSDVGLDQTISDNKQNLADKNSDYRTSTNISKTKDENLHKDKQIDLRTSNTDPADDEIMEQPNLPLSDSKPFDSFEKNCVEEKESNSRISDMLSGEPMNTLEQSGGNTNSIINKTELVANDKLEKVLEKDDNSANNVNDVNKMPFGLCSNKSLESDDIDHDDDDKSDSSDEVINRVKKEKDIDSSNIEGPEMMSPKSRIDYLNDMRTQLGNLITKGPSIVATNLLHGVSEPPIGSPKDKAVPADIDTWEVLAPTSSSSSTTDHSLHGMLTREGQMVSFVADDIMEKIRQSASPMASSRGSPASSMTTSGPDTPSMLSRAESFSRSNIPTIDPAVIVDIEKHCKRVTDSLDLMLGNLTGSIHNMSAITVGHIQTYKDAADKVGITVDESVKEMYALMAKCEQLNKMMQPVQQLAQQIKDIKRLLDDFESRCK